MKMNPYTKTAKATADGVRAGKLGRVYGNPYGHGSRLWEAFAEGFNYGDQQRHERALPPVNYFHPNVQDN